ncbi:uncharacterized protein LOC131858263 [Cryptomeria japonica]|uniref:uncharacterized protein LOC131858263 n=1 Tax=Cryptomeria japonica TaxID=3369 RepID=UPI0027D9FD30|nr:uncharacterized protein LOC131858263 [Cryptomeria japonica]
MEADNLLGGQIPREEIIDQNEPSKENTQMVIADTLASKEDSNEEDQKDKDIKEVEQCKEGEITGSQEEKADSSPLTNSSNFQEAHKCAILGLSLSDSDHAYKIVNNSSHESRSPIWGNEEEIHRILSDLEAVFEKEAEWKIPKHRNKKGSTPSASQIMKSNRIAQKRKKQKRQGNSELESEGKVQSKDPDEDQKVEEITGDGFNQSGGGDADQITGGDAPKTDHAKAGEKIPPSNPFVEGLKGFVDTLNWFINSHKKVVEENKKLSYRVQILETINIGEGKSMVEYVDDLRKTMARAEEIRDAFNPRFEQVEMALDDIKTNDNATNKRMLEAGGKREGDQDGDDEEDGEDKGEEGKEDEEDEEDEDKEKDGEDESDAVPHHSGDDTIALDLPSIPSRGEKDPIRGPHSSPHYPMSTVQRHYEREEPSGSQSQELASKSGAPLYRMQ